ncbi:MAG: hypothetical protein QG608_3824 [Actinomycetota bacterium]|nr:hypothetical protein [Actinomycetota bacterium]
MKWKFFLPNRPRDVRFTPQWQRCSRDDAAGESELLETLRSDVEGYALELRDWYLKDKRIQRVRSRSLRAGAILFAGAGGLVPLLHAGTGTGTLGWGYVLLASAGIFLAFDRFFGISAAWMRDISTAQSLDRLLIRLQISLLQASLRAETEERTKEIISVISEFADEIIECVGAETMGWREDFVSGQAELMNSPGSSPGQGLR